MNQAKLHQIGNMAGLFLVCVILSITFADQFTRHDLPCPLCLLQRAAFVAIGLCLCMNLMNGIKTAHYGLMTLSALLGFTTSLRQVFLHLSPGDPGYGHLIFGINLYVLSTIAFLIVVTLIGIALLLEKGFVDTNQNPRLLLKTLMIYFLGLILANVISTFAQCTFFACASNPVNYKLLSGR